MDHVTKYISTWYTSLQHCTRVNVFTSMYSLSCCSCSNQEKPDWWVPGASSQIAAWQKWLRAGLEHDDATAASTQQVEPISLHAGQQCSPVGLRQVVSPGQTHHVSDHQRRLRGRPSFPFQMGDFVGWLLQSTLWHKSKQASNCWVFLCMEEDWENKLKKKKMFVFFIFYFNCVQFEKKVDISGLKSFFLS